MRSLVAMNNVERIGWIAGIAQIKGRRIEQLEEMQVERWMKLAIGQGRKEAETQDRTVFRMQMYLDTQRD